MSNVFSERVKDIWVNNHIRQEAEKRYQLFIAFRNLERVYDIEDHSVMWRVLELDGIAALF